MDKKLAKLERKTQAAIHTLIRKLVSTLWYQALKTTAHGSSGQRLAAQRDGEETVDLAGTIAAKAKADEEDIDEDDDE